MMKYIKTLSNELVVFPESISHDMFKSLQPVSAGFLLFIDNKVKCYGESMTLHLKSDPEYDTQLALKQFKNLLLKSKELE